mgnify:FL=1
MDWRKCLPRVYDAFFTSFGRLRPAQESAIPLVLRGRNLLLIAPTGSGKTEAVVAPIAEMALDHPNTTFALYIAPTRALVNDLETRLAERLAACGLRLAVRHGERKTIRGRQVPAIILTTPESLEVMLTLQHDEVRDRLREVRAVIVDETHQFYGTPRGLHLYCLLERLKSYTRRPLQRLCLSATVGEPELVAEFFQGSDAPLEVVRVPGARRLEIFLDQILADSLDGLADAAAQWLSEILQEHQKVLLFANTRVQCDWLRWQLGERIRNVPILLHYSSLHRTYREEVERIFREQKTAVCIATSTLELGIDIGDVDAVAMWGAPNTVTSFLQRLGRGNRRTDISIVYAACPAYHPSGADADPDSHLLTFVALTSCAVKSELETRVFPRYHSVLAQQLLALCSHWGTIAPDGFARAVARPPAFASAPTLTAILDELTNVRVLERSVRHHLWSPTDKFHHWQKLGLFWGNIPEQAETTVVRDGDGRAIPIADIPREYSYRLQPGDIVLVAGQPRLVLDIESQYVRVLDLATSDAELTRYRTPPEPIPARVAREIANVISMPDAELARLPIGYSEQARQRLREWRVTLQPRLASRQLVAREPRGSWVVYTFAGTVANLLLAHWLKEQGARVLDQDSWRVWCADPPPLHTLSACTPDALERLMRPKWRVFLKNLPVPPLFRYLPDTLQRDEVLSMLDLETSAHLLRELAQAAADA